MTAPPAWRLSGALGPILFDLLLVGFSALIVVSALGLSRGAGTVPLVIGVPTLIGCLGVLVRDLLKARRSDSPASDAPEASGSGKLGIPIDEPETPDQLRHQAMFAAWMIGFVAIAALTSFYIAVPISLVALFIAVRIPPLTILVSVGFVVLLLYGLFDLFLKVRL